MPVCAGRARPGPGGRFRAQGQAQWHTFVRLRVGRGGVHGVQQLAHCTLHPLRALNIAQCTVFKQCSSGPESESLQASERPWKHGEIGQLGGKRGDWGKWGEMGLVLVLVRVSRHVQQAGRCQPCRASHNSTHSTHTAWREMGGNGLERNEGEWRKMGGNGGNGGGGGAGTCLSGGGGPGEGGTGSRGEPPPPPAGTPNPQGTGKLLENEQLSTWKCHVLGRNQRKSIIECQFRVPTSHQYTTTATKRDIHHLMPNDSDLSCQSELDLPELEPPSVVELELDPNDDDEPESLPEWETSDKLSDSASSSTDTVSEGTSAFRLL